VNKLKPILIKIKFFPNCTAGQLTKYGKYLLFLLPLIFSSTHLLAQISSDSTGNWDTPGTWDAAVPTASDNVNVDHEVTIQSGTSAEVNDLIINADGKVIVYGTLIVNNNMTMNFQGNNESEFEIKPNSVVIVKGDVYLTTKVSLNLSSYFIVLGNLDAQSSSNNTDVNIDDASIYVFGSVGDKIDLDTCNTYDGLTEDNNENCHIGTETAYDTNVDNGTVPSEIDELINTCTPPSFTLNPLTSDQNYCVGESSNSLTVSASGDGLTYQWYSNTSSTNNGGTALTGETDAIFIPSTATAGSLYFYCVVNGECGTDTSDVSGLITVFDLPNNTSSGFNGSTICAGEDGVLTFNALNSTFVSPYTIEYTDGSTTWQQTINSDADFEFNVAVNPASTTTYTLTSISNGNCARTSGFGDATAQIVVRELPNNTTSGFSGTTICEGETGVLTFNALNATFVQTYTIEYTDGSSTWQQEISSDADYDFNVAVNPTSTTDYTLISITNGNGCVRTSDFGDSTARIIVKEFNMLVTDETPIASGNHCPEFGGPFNANTESYNPGVTEVVFKVERESSTSSNWTFDFAIDETGEVEVYDLVVTGNNSSISFAGDEATGSIDATDNTEVIFTFQIWNVPGTALDVDFTVSNGNDDNCDETGTLTDNNEIHTINVMPVVGTFNP
jgi:hypothetical protein